MRELLSLPGLPDDAIYKEVVVIGNGPSGISASHQLAGNWATLRSATLGGHPDAMLGARLRGADPRPLPLLPLGALAEGLEGRSKNPIPLLVDSLMHPGADMGSEAPSMLEWKYYPERQIDHVVLGRGRPGGLWHRLDPLVATLSPARWMGLPNMPSTHAQPRAPVRSIALYYERYVVSTGIQRFFRNHTMVTAIRPIKLLEKGENGVESVNQPVTPAWCVCGYDTFKKETFHYICSRVILATGASDRPNPLEGAGLCGAIRAPVQLRRALDAMEEAKEKGGENPLPVLVIGSGLSAADAILRLRSSGLPMAHVYRGASSALRSLPADLYPEYHQVHEMMKTGVSGNNPLYTAFPDHSLLEIHQNGKIIEDGHDPTDIFAQRTVKLLNSKTDETLDIEVSLCVILIGSRPDLYFLPDNFESSCITWNLDGLKSSPKNFRKEQTFEMSLTEESSGKLMPHPTEMCIRCSYKNQNRRKTKPNDCFLKTQWENLKYIVGGLQKSRQDDRKENCEPTSNGKYLLNESDVKVLNAVENIHIEDCVSKNDLPGSGLGLGVVPTKPIDCRNNPVSIDKLSHEVLNAPKGLYVLGPLAGDNFVRFIPGGALAIVSHIWKEKKAEEGNN